MRLLVAKAQIEREHPELTGREKLAAIKELRAANTEPDPESDWSKLNGLAQTVIVIDWLTPLGVIVGAIGWFAGWPYAAIVFWVSLAGFFVLTTAYGLLHQRGKA